MKIGREDEIVEDVNACLGSSGFMVSGFNGVVLVQEEVAFGVDKSGLPKKRERERTAEERSWKGGV